MPLLVVRVLEPTLTTIVFLSRSAVIFVLGRVSIELEGEAFYVDVIPRLGALRP